MLLLVLVLRSFLFEPYQIPSESMVPTLEVGDFILVNKFAYGIRLPVLGTKIFDVGEPQRGDVMVFIPPHEPRYFIKRVVGLPGDHVRYQDKVLTINGLNALRRSTSTRSPSTADLTSRSTTKPLEATATASTGILRGSNGRRSGRFPRGTIS